MDDETVYEEVHLPLDIGDSILMFTDGLTEAMNEEHIPKYNHFLKKRMSWKKQEVENIQEFVRDRLATVSGK